jgi:hypothetical protein
VFDDAERLLAREPEPHSPSRDPQRVRVLEQRLGVPLPDAIHAWYSRDDALRVLAVHSNADRPVAVDDMKLVDGRIVFLVENQGVCRWAFDRAGEIAVRYDKGWESCGCDLPAFIAAQIFDWAEGWCEDARILVGDPPSADTLAWLGSRFQRGSAVQQRDWPIHRFFDDLTRITILGDSWWVKAASFAEMDRLLDMLQPFYDAEQ